MPPAASLEARGMAPQMSSVGFGVTRVGGTEGVFTVCLGPEESQARLRLEEMDDEVNDLLDWNQNKLDRMPALATTAC